MAEVTETGIVPVEEFKLVIEAGPDCLAINRNKAEKAVAFGKDLLERINQNGMTDELDAECNGYLVKLKNTYTDMYDRRKPLTEMFDTIRKTFTALESQLDGAKKESIYAQIQEKRNAYAAAKAAERKRMEEEAQKKLIRERELVEAKHEAELSLRERFLSQLTTARIELTDCFEALTLANWDDQLQIFHSYAQRLTYSATSFNSLKCAIRSTYVTISPEDWQRIEADCRVGKHEAWAKEYHEAMVVLFNNLNMKVHSKRQELEEIERQRIAAEEAAKKAAEEKDAKLKAELEAAAQKAKEEQERLAKEAEERKALEAAQQAEEAAKREQEAVAQSEVSKQVELTNTLFNSELELMGAPETKAIESYEIVVKNAPAWLLIVSFYFEKEGKNLTVDQLASKKLDSMRTFCERHYKKTGEQIVSPHIEYKPVYAVRTTK